METVTERERVCVCKGILSNINMKNVYCDGRRFVEMCFSHCRAEYVT